MQNLGDQAFDVKDMLLEAQADVQEIMREVMQEIAMPQMMTTFKVQWAKMPNEMKERFAKERPEEYRKLMEIMQ